LEDTPWIPANQLTAEQLISEETLYFAVRDVLRALPNSISSSCDFFHAVDVAASFDFKGLLALSAKRFHKSAVCVDPADCSARFLSGFHVAFRVPQKRTKKR
jgi:hypothetical protein